MQGSECRIQGSGFRVQGSGVTVEGSGSRIPEGVRGAEEVGADRGGDVRVAECVLGLGLP